MRPADSRRGFTLIEILIVISIIAVLASMILAGVSIARKNTTIAVCKQNIDSIASAMEQYKLDTGKYPGEKIKDFENGFPALFEALLGEKPPRGGGGPNAPYMKYKEADVQVWDDDEGKYRQATVDERWDQRVEKYLADPWGNPLIYHENKSRARQQYMHNRDGADVYSVGPDKEDQTIEGLSGPKIDDIGNW